MPNLSNYTKEFKYNFKIAYPVILGMLGHTFVGFVDNVMVGKVGITELGAAALGNTAIFIAMSFAIGFSVATTSLVAMNDEAGDKQTVQSILNHSMLLNIILSTVLFLLMFFVEPVMRITGQSENVIALAVPYTHLVAFSLIPLGVFSTFKQFADGLSMTKYAMYVTLLANLINIFGNYLFIYGNWGCPKLGVLGAGVGTLISRIAMPIMLYYMLKYLPKTKEYVTHISFKNITKPMIRKISNIGLPTGLQMIFETGIFSAAIWISGVLGENQLSANQIALNLASMTFMVANGLGITAMIRVGNQLGAKKLCQFTSGSLFCILISVVYPSLFCRTLSLITRLVTLIVFRDGQYRKSSYQCSCNKRSSQSIVDCCYFPNLRWITSYSSWGIAWSPRCQNSYGHYLYSLLAHCLPYSLFFRTSHFFRYYGYLDRITHRTHCCCYIPLV